MPGTLGKYQIKRTIGVGSSCKVKLATVIGTGEQVALKLLYGLSKEVKDLIFIEIEAMEHLKHNNIS